MRYFVSYVTGLHDSSVDVEFATEQQVIELLNRHAANPDFKFDVIQGHRVIFEPVSVATQYRKK